LDQFFPGSQREGFFRLDMPHRRDGRSAALWLIRWMAGAAAVVLFGAALTALSFTGAYLYGLREADTLRSVHKRGRHELT